MVDHECQSSILINRSIQAAIGVCIVHNFSIMVQLQQYQQCYTNPFDMRIIPS